LSGGAGARLVIIRSRRGCVQTQQEKYNIVMGPGEGVQTREGSGGARKEGRVVWGGNRTRNGNEKMLD